MNRLYRIGELGTAFSQVAKKGKEAGCSCPITAWAHQIQEDDGRKIRRAGAGRQKVLRQVAVWGNMKSFHVEVESEKCTWIADHRHGKQHTQASAEWKPVPTRETRSCHGE